MFINKTNEILNIFKNELTKINNLTEMINHEISNKTDMLNKHKEIVKDKYESYINLNNTNSKLNNVKKEYKGIIK